jgi:hypothetical protein
MNENRIPAFRLWQRVSCSGNSYLAGYLGQMGVIAFIDPVAELREGVEEVWQIYFTEREPRPAAASPEPQRRPRRAEPEVDHE